MNDNISQAKKKGQQLMSRRLRLNNISGIEHLIEILNEMVEELKDLSKAAHDDL
jgi:hypothetical protein